MGVVLILLALCGYIEKASEPPCVTSLYLSAAERDFCLSDRGARRAADRE